MLLNDRNLFIIITTYNPRQWIEKCLNSLKASNVPYQCIIVDNNSDDGSLKEMEKKFPEFEYIFLKENLGFGTANNVGIKMAYETGADYVFLLNQDAYIESQTLSVLLKHAIDNPEYGILSPLHFNGDGSGLDYLFSTFISADRCKGLISDFFTGVEMKELYQIKFVNAAAWLLSRKCIETVGGFNPSFYHYGEDLNYIERVQYHELKVGIVPTAKIYHDRQNRKSNSFLKPEITYPRVVIRYLSKPKNNRGFTYFLFKEILFLGKSIFQFRKKPAHSSFNNIRLLSRIKYRSISRNRKQSLRKGLNFLKS